MSDFEKNNDNSSATQQIFLQKQFKEVSVQCYEQNCQNKFQNYKDFFDIFVISFLKLSLVSNIQLIILSHHENLDLLHIDFDVDVSPYSERRYFESNQ